LAPRKSALILGESSPPRCKVDGSADAIAVHRCGLELSAGEAPIADQGFVGRSLLVGPLEQARLSVGCTCLGRLAPYEEAGDRQTLRPDRPHARHDAPWHSR